VLEVALAGV
jgi:hypothetical protein